MKNVTLFITLAVLVCTQSLGGTTITYTFDKQHRLTSADYSAAQADAHVVYQYDAANNLDVYVAITDGQYLKSFLWYFSYLRTPITSPHSYAGVSWPEIWASLSTKS